MNEDRCWGDRSSDTDGISYDSEHDANPSILENQALLMVDLIDNVEALAIDVPNNDCVVEKTSRFIEEKMIEIANVLGISMDDRLGGLRSLIRDMMKVKGRSTGGHKTKKKSKAQREFEQLAFSVNYDHADKHMGVALLGLRRFYLGMFVG